MGFLFESVANFESLLKAARRAARGLRQRPAVARFLADIEVEVLALERELLSGTYNPQPPTTFRIKDPKPRIISAAAFRDRVVHHALCAVLEPSFERYADPCSFACRQGKGNLAAVKKAQALSRRFAWSIKLDVRHFFETVDLRVLEGMLLRRFPDRPLLELVRVILRAGAASPDRGLPIGNLTSQHFGNFYLGRFDHHAREVLRVPAMVRYMDDILLFAHDKEDVRWLGEQAGLFLGDTLHVEVKDEATVIAPVHVGIPFLGFRIWPRLIRFDGARARRFRRHFRALERARIGGLTSEEEAARRAQSLFGWAAQAQTFHFRRTFLARLGSSGSREME